MKIYLSALCLCTIALAQVFTVDAYGIEGRFKLLKGKDYSLCQDVVDMLNHPDNAKFNLQDRKLNTEFVIPKAYNEKYGWATWVNVTQEEFNEGWLYKDDIVRINNQTKKTGEFYLQKTNPRIALDHQNGLETAFRYRHPSFKNRCTFSQGQSLYPLFYLKSYAQDCAFLQDVTFIDDKKNVHYGQAKIVSKKLSKDNSDISLVVTGVNIREMVGADKKPFLHTNFMDLCKIKSS